MTVTVECAWEKRKNNFKQFMQQVRRKQILPAEVASSSTSPPPLFAHRSFAVKSGLGRVSRRHVMLGSKQRTTLRKEPQTSRPVG